jgi:hypothetical protein
MSILVATRPAAGGAHVFDASDLYASSYREIGAGDISIALVGDQLVMIDPTALRSVSVTSGCGTTASVSGSAISINTTLSAATAGASGISVVAAVAKSAGDLQFRTVATAGTGIAVAVANDIITLTGSAITGVAATAGSGISVSTAGGVATLDYSGGIVSVGSGNSSLVAAVAVDATSGDFRLKRLAVSGTGLAITDSSDLLTIALDNAAAGITSVVAAAGSGITVSTAGGVATLNSDLITEILGSSTGISVSRTDDSVVVQNTLDVTSLGNGTALFHANKIDDRIQLRSLAVSNTEVMSLSVVSSGANTGQIVLGFTPYQSWYTDIYPQQQATEIFSGTGCNPEDATSVAKVADSAESATSVATITVRFSRTAGSSNMVVNLPHAVKYRAGDRNLYARLKWVTTQFDKNFLLSYSLPLISNGRPIVCFVSAAIPTGALPDETSSVQNAADFEIVHSGYFASSTVNRSDGQIVGSGIGGSGGGIGNTYGTASIRPFFSRCPESVSVFRADVGARVQHTHNFHLTAADTSGLGVGVYFLYIAAVDSTGFTVCNYDDDTGGLHGAPYAGSNADVAYSSTSASMYAMRIN